MSIYEGSFSEQWVVEYGSIVLDHFVVRGKRTFTSMDAKNDYVEFLKLEGRYAWRLWQINSIRGGVHRPGE